MTFKQVLLLTLFFLVGVVRADEFQDRVLFWESNAFVCTEGGHNFPSKYRPADADNPSQCEDGDMTLFNGLLCAAGDDRGCEGVRRAQGSDGRWWRSPRRIGVESAPGNTNDVSFSPDMATGVFHYIINKSDANSFKLWTTWIGRNAPCLVDIAGSCRLRGWPRLCPDDWQDKRCTFRPATCNDLELVGAKLNAPDGKICRDVLAKFKIRADYILPTAEMAASAALVNERGYPMHLAAAQIFLLEKMGLASVYTRAGAVSLALRDSKNPFFLYLAEGATSKVKEMILAQCPTPQKPSTERTQWAWERDSGEKAWEKSMYWDCIFMAKLVGY